MGVCKTTPRVCGLHSQVRRRRGVASRKWSNEECRRAGPLSQLGIGPAEIEGRESPLPFDFLTNGRSRLLTPDLHVRECTRLRSGPASTIDAPIGISELRCLTFVLESGPGDVVTEGCPDPRCARGESGASVALGAERLVSACALEEGGQPLWGKPVTFR